MTDRVVKQDWLRLNIHDFVDGTIRYMICRIYIAHGYSIRRNMFTCALVWASTEQMKGGIHELFVDL